MVAPVDLVALRSARETLWYGIATIQEYRMAKDPITKQMKSTLVDLYTDLPCKLSHKAKNANDQLPTGPAVLDQRTWISIGNEHNIPAGCKITVTQNGKTEEYKQSGEPAMFLVHQEIPLELYEEYA